MTRAQEEQLDALLDRAIGNLVVGPANAPYDGKMFETFGPEYEAVVEQAKLYPNRVATLLDCDGKLYVVHGWHYVNRLGYFLFSYDVPPFEELRAG